MHAQSTEELLETLTILRRDNEELRTASAHAGRLLAALASLLTIGPQDDPFANVFAPLRHTFSFDQVMALVENGTRLECIAADPADLVGLTFSIGGLFRKVVDGRVVATFSNHGIAEWETLGGNPISDEQPALYLPVQMRDKRGIVILLRAVGSSDFDRTDIELARKFALLASHALAMRHTNQSESESSRLRELSEELAHRAYYDSLTELPNRAFIEQKVEAALRLPDCGRFALVFIDIDHFKQINDYYSHAIGDALLVAVAKTISRNIRSTDTLARISGDEFILMLTPFEDAADLDAVIRRLLDELRQPFAIENYTIFASASMGVSLYPEHGQDYATLRRNADGAMYRAKSVAKGNVAYFDSSMTEALTARMGLEQRLRRAIRDKRFFCVFQPKVEFRSLKVIGFEALVRWRDDQGVIQAPGMFVDLAVELGLIDEITHVVVEQSLRAFRELDPIFGPQTTISINLAARQAGDLSFMTTLASELGASGFARRVMLELTEDAMISYHEFQSRVLPILRAAGIRISIDDFGTGYSSLAALADITADEVKVDRSFITAIHQRPRSQGILKAMVSLAETLGMTLVAEGVETVEELAYLSRETSIHLVQGYFFSKPKPLEDILAFPLWDVSSMISATLGAQGYPPLYDKDEFGVIESHRTPGAASTAA